MTVAAQTAPQAPDLNLLQAIEMVAKEKGIDRLRLVKTIEEAILKAAQSVFGPNRELEARFNEDNGQVDLFQYMTVVDDPSDDDREIALEDAQKAGLEAELGEELGFQIFWHPADAKKAAEQEQLEKEKGLLEKAQDRVVAQYRRGHPAGQAGAGRTPDHNMPKTTSERPGGTGPDPVRPQSAEAHSAPAK